MRWSDWRRYDQVQQAVDLLLWDPLSVLTLELSMAKECLHWSRPSHNNLQRNIFFGVILNLLAFDPMVSVSPDLICNGHQVKKETQATYLTSFLSIIDVAAVRWRIWALNKGSDLIPHVMKYIMITCDHLLSMNSWFLLSKMIILQTTIYWFPDLIIWNKTIHQECKGPTSVEQIIQILQFREAHSMVKCS